jgi:hypothetical protein
MSPGMAHRTPAQSLLIKKMSESLIQKVLICKCYDEENGLNKKFDFNIAHNNNNNNNNNKDNNENNFNNNNNNNNNNNEIDHWEDLSPTLSASSKLLNKTIIKNNVEKNEVSVSFILQAKSINNENIEKIDNICLFYSNLILLQKFLLFFLLLLL